MLAIRGVDDNAQSGVTNVKRSGAYTPADTTVIDGSVFGAAYINNGKAPAVTLADTYAEAGIRLGIKGATAAHFVRIHQIIHLRHALNLSFSDTDLLVMSALKAEGQTKNFHLTENTLRAIGVFRYYNEKYAVTAEQFAALIHEVTPYAVGEQTPFLDRVLDGPGAGDLAKVDAPLNLNGSEFNLDEGTDSEGENSSLLISRIGKALGANEQQTRNYLTQALKALSIKKAKLSLPLISSLYRLNRLPRRMGLSLTEGAHLVEILALDNGQVHKLMAGKAQISDAAGKADILDVLIALANAKQWLDQNRLKSSAVLALLTPPDQTPEILAAIESARAKILGDNPPDIASTCLSEDNIKKALSGNQTLKTDTSTWLTLLSAYVDDKGLIKSGLPEESTLKTALATLLAGELKNTTPDEATAAGEVASVLINARVAQEDLAKAMFGKAFGDALGDPGSASAYALPLLKWIKKDPADLLGDLLTPTVANAESCALWRDMVRFTLTARLTGLSTAGLEALVAHPEQFDVAAATSGRDAPAINVELLYQLTSYRRWTGICKENAVEEQNALNYLTRLRSSDKPEDIRAAAKQVGTIIGWSDSEALLAAPYTTITRQIEKPLEKGSIEEFASSLTGEDLGYWNYCNRKVDGGGLRVVLQKYSQNGGSYRKAASLYRRFKSFINTLTTPLKVQNKNFLPETVPSAWRDINKGSRANTITLEKYDLFDHVEDDQQQAYSNISDINFALRLQGLCKRSGLSCQSLLDLSWLGEESNYEDFQTTAQLLQAACTEKELAAIAPRLQEQWRDAVVDYLLGYWTPTNPNRQAELATVDDLSSYFLTDVSTSFNAMETTHVTQAIASLQHYLFRLFSHLEPGYKTANISPSANQHWERHLSQYGTWKVWRAQINHPENLIYYANRPNKSKAFQELEVEVNQGKLDTDLLETAVCNYLTKFERLSNLQIVSGYLDGRDPLNDTYYLIGKTNASPTEYYWRSVDMGLRDDQQRLSPLAWSEWKKVDLTITGVIVQSQYIEQFDQVDASGNVQRDDRGNVLKDSSKNITHTCDAIRPVIIAGRPYVFWVERGTTGLPSGDEKNQTPTQFKKLSVQYAYLQSDGFWSTANELMCLDGTKDGKRLDDKDNHYLKDESYVPGLIVFVNIADERLEDPWLTVFLYDCKKTATAPGDSNKDYFIEMRDLLLIESKQLSAASLENLTTVTLNTYDDIRFVQHIYDGTLNFVTPLKSPEHSELEFELESELEYGLKSNSDLRSNFTTRPKDKELTPTEKTQARILFAETIKGNTISQRNPKTASTVYAIALSETAKNKIKTATTAYRSAKESYEYSKIYHSLEASHATKKSLDTAVKALSDMIGTALSDIASKAMTFKIEIPFAAKKTLKLEAHYNDNVHFRYAPFGAFGIEIKSPSDTEFKNLVDSQLSHIETSYDYTEEGTYEFYVYKRLDRITIYESHYTYDISTSKTDESWNVAIFNNTEQAQYLDLTSVEDRTIDIPSKRIRLNTLFGKQLVARASQSVERALAWDTQKLKEPTIDDNFPNPSVDFHGANGIYFRELFLHLPALIANRLTEQQQFEEAESWYLRNLFDPYRAVADDDRRPAHWNTRPLAEVGTLTSELSKPVDPTARAFILSRYYRQAVFLGLVENWQRQGDHYFRQLTLSSLNHAWLCYQQALKLIGPLPERTEVSRWSPLTLSDINESLFFTPINQRVLDARKALERRVHNLRHGLTIDGKTLPDVGWSDEGEDPFAAAKGGLSIVPTTYNSDRIAIPAYRFRAMLPVARAAAQLLLDLGRHYMKLMEDEFNTTLDVLLKSQEIKISDFTLRLKREDISSIFAKKKGLELSRQAALYRKDFYAELINNGRNTLEEASAALVWTAGYLNFVTAPLSVAEGVAKAVPRIFGFSVGGQDISGPVGAAKEIVEGMATSMNFIADQLLRESDYERRAHQWGFDRRQAEWDIELIDQQIVETNIELNAAKLSLEEARQERLNLDEAYVAMTTGFTIIPIYNWLVARQELIYGKAYDAVLSLCLGLEAAWRYEIGDYKRDAFIKTSAWSDSYKGMLAGESLLVDLQEMENAYLLANERRLTIKKSISLKALLSTTSWVKAMEGLRGAKPLMFEFKASDFDRNYPGHYLRQLKHVSVSFVMQTGATLDGMSAILTQVGNTTLIEPDKKGAEWLYQGGKELPGSIKRNLRAQQQIALSSLVAEDGLGYNPGEWVYELMFHDGRYLPFEGTGAISQWQLQIPDVEFATSLMTNNGSDTVVKDIQINLVYTALGADSDFTMVIGELRKGQPQLGA